MRALRLGALRGIPVEVHWGAGAIVLILAFVLGSSALPSLAPGYGDAAYLIAGAIAGIGLLASVFVHEAAHALVALRYDVPVKSIRLWILGGVAHLEKEAPHPKAEMRIAGVGPLTSIVVGVAVGVVAWVWFLLGLDQLLGISLLWLAGTNGVLAIFNLLPGLPLDGGRLLHAWLWKRRGDRAAASISAAKAGRVIGGLLIAIGFIEVVVAGNFGGLWTSFIGWFLTMAAGQEGAAARVDSAFGDLVVEDVMRPLPLEVPDWLPLRELLQQPAWAGRDVFLAVDFGGDPSAVVALTDLPARMLNDARIRDLALPSPIEVEAGTPAATAARELTGPLLVVKDGRPIGIVLRSDIARAVALSRMGLRPGGTPVPATDPA